MMPPYAKLIQARRARGLHPVRAIVVFSARWYKPPAQDQELFPQIMVPREEYQPGKYDFRTLAGVAAQIITDPDEFRLRPRRDGRMGLRAKPRLFTLAAEVAAHAAPVYLSRGSAAADEWFEYYDVLRRYFSAVNESTGVDEYMGYARAEAVADYLRRAQVYAEFFFGVMARPDWPRATGGRHGGG